MTELVKEATEVILQRLLGGVWKPSFFTIVFPFLSPCPAVLSVICLFACQENVCVCVCVCVSVCFPRLTLDMTGGKCSSQFSGELSCVWKHLINFSSMMNSQS